jgi:hypothetical protein
MDLVMLGSSVCPHHGVTMHIKNYGKWKFFVGM